MKTKTFFTYTTKNGVEYKYRKGDGINVAEFNSWKCGNYITNGGIPTDEDDKEFDSFIDFYINYREYNEWSDERLKNNYKHF